MTARARPHAARTLALALTLAGAAAAAAAMLPAAACAQAAAKATVDAAKAAGVVGEQADGYLGFVGAPDAATQAAVAQINAGRAAAYRDAAARTGTSAAAAGEAAFQMLMSRMPPGQYYRSPGGGWMRK